MTKTKLLRADVKADSSGTGVFTGYASVFGVVDRVGDMVMPGAFAESLEQYDGGAGIPCYWEHRTGDPFMLVGQTVEAQEDEHGLFVKVQLDLENPTAKQAHKLVTQGLVKQMSFAYDVLDYAITHDEDAGDYVELRKLALHEVSIVPLGANQDTAITSAKSRRAPNLQRARALMAMARIH